MKPKGRDVTRRDFVKGTLIGTGATLLTMPPPLSAVSTLSDSPKLQSTEAIQPWNGYPGVGDYARSNGNTESVRAGAHLLRDGKIDGLLEKSVIDVDVLYDLIILGGGFAGMSAARTFIKESKPGQKCLVLENHALPGGEAKRNEFIVDGYTISGPQGSNLAVEPSEKGSWYDKLWKELNIPRNPAFQELSGHQGELRISTTNYVPMFGVAEQAASAGYFFDKESFGLKEDYWDIDSSQNGYANTAFSAAEKNDLNRLKQGVGKNLAGDNWKQWLDSITYREYLAKVLEIESRVIDWMDKTLVTTAGLGSDAISALHAMIVGSPGFDKGFSGPSLYRIPPEDKEVAGLYTFPGGNDGIYRLLLKRVLPEAIAGGNSLEEVHDSAYNFKNFDKQDNQVRIRLDSTALRVEHNGAPSEAESVTVYYLQSGKVYRVKARGVVSAVGGWVNKHLVQGLPPEYSEAYDALVYGSNMIINVALRNWRPMAKLGISGCHFFSENGLGGFCNIKKPMLLGKNQAPLDPDSPVVMTFYVGFPKKGMPAKQQAAVARGELLAKSYAEIESSVRDQLTRMFGSLGFDAEKDIAGITVNRWGHSYISPTPGFYYGVDGKPPPQESVTQPFGRVTFGHSENGGVQEWFGAVEQGERAAQQALKIINS